MALALRSRLINGRDQENKQQTIRDLVNDFVQLAEKSENRLNDTQKIELHVAMASIFNGVEMPGDAIAWYRKAAELNPMLALKLSQVLAKNGRQQEGVSILIEGYQTADDINKIKYVSAICNILTVGVPSRELVMMAEPVFQSALSNFPNDIELLVNLANVRYVAENRFDDAVALYQEARRLLPNSPGLLNNLATILSDEPSMLDDALATINEAIDKGGKVPTLLDTKAVILAKMGRRKEAKDMLDNIVHSNADARYWWHLSEVEFQLFEAERNPTYLKSAKKSFELAKTNGLDQQILTPGETRRISELNKKLAQLDGTN